MADAKPKKDEEPQEPGPKTPANDAAPVPATPAVPSPPLGTPPETPPVPAPPAAPAPANDVKPAPPAASLAAAPVPVAPNFNPKIMMPEGTEKSAFPRVWKDSGFEKFLRFIGQGDIVDAMRQRKNKAHHIGQAVTSKIGFGDIYRAACGPAPKIHNTLKAIGAKAADMTAGRLVSGSVKLIAITFVAGMIGGVTGWGSIALLALATGASSGIYNYGKSYVTDMFAATKEERKNIKFFTKKRALEALKAFGSGTANGAFGAWLAKLPLFQSVMKHLHDSIHQSIQQITPPMGDGAPKSSSFFSRHLWPHFNKAAHGNHAAPIPTPAAHPAPAPG